MLLPATATTNSCSTRYLVIIDTRNKHMLYILLRTKHAYQLIYVWLSSRLYYQSRGPNNHGVLYSRLSQLKVPMGRHLFRTFDVHIARYSGWALKNLTKEGGGYNNLRLTGGRGQFMRWNSATKSLRYVPKNELSLMMGDIDVRAEYDWPQYIGSRCTSSEMVVN